MEWMARILERIANRHIDWAERRADEKADRVSDDPTFWRSVVAGLSDDDQRAFWMAIGDIRRARRHPAVMYPGYGTYSWLVRDALDVARMRSGERFEEGRERLLSDYVWQAPLSPAAPPDFW